jgi:hypothetical protein
MSELGQKGRPLPEGICDVHRSLEKDQVASETLDWPSPAHSPVVGEDLLGFAMNRLY